MPMSVRATTTTNAAQGRRQHFALPSTPKSNGPDIEYLQALKVIDQTRRGQNVHPAVRQKRPKPFYQFTSTLTPIAQQAMVKTYEDTLISHLTSVYSSKRISGILPRLTSAAFRPRLPTIRKNPNHFKNIEQAQDIIDNILNKNSQKEEVLSDYVRWQDNWTRNS